MKKIIFGIALLSSFVLSGQKYELGDVTLAELQQQVHPRDSTASAAILFKKALVKFGYTEKNGFFSETEVTIKIKIYKKEGLNWANFEVPYYVGYSNLDDETISFSRATAYTNEGGSIVKTKVTSENQFKEQINEYWKTKTLTFPNVRVGSILELKYVFKTQNLSELPEFQFQYKIPVDYAELVTEIPEFYIYKGILTGFVKIDSDQKLKGKSISYVNEHNQTEFLSFREIETVYKVKEVPALIEEDYVDNISNYFGQIDHELQTIRMPGQQPKEVATTWEDVTKSIYAEKGFGGELSKFEYFTNDLNQLLIGKTTNHDKAEAIFNFVKNRMTWNNRRGYYTMNGVEKAYAERSGNSADINLILVSMFRMAGLQANPVLISTRDNGKAPFPTRSLFNYVLAAVLIDDKQVLFDATDKRASADILPLRDLNGSGRLIEKSGSNMEIDLVPKIQSKQIASMLATINPDGTVSGQLRNTYTNYKAFTYRDKFAGLNLDNYIDNLQQRNSNIEINGYKRENVDEPAEPLSESYSFKFDNAADVISDKIYFSPMLFLATAENPFKQEFRLYPVDFIYPLQEKYNIVLTIPDGYIVETLPASANLVMESNRGSFRYNIVHDRNTIKLSVTFDILTPVISSGGYSMLKTFFQAMIDKENENIVLKKA